MAPLRVVTWNVNSIRARLPRVLELLAAHAPDVVCLQELKCPTAGVPTIELAAAGYDIAAHGSGRWAGVAILARRQLGLRDIVRGLDGEPDPSTARWIEASVADMRVASVYVPNGREVGHPAFRAKLAFLDAVAGRAAELARGSAVLAGDWNVAPSDRDVWDPGEFAGATHVTDAERGRFAAVLDAGLHDAFRVLRPDTQQFTWWDYRGGAFHRGLGMRIDALLVTSDIAGRLRTCGIDRDFRKGSKPSDHAPLLAEWC